MVRVVINGGRASLTRLEKKPGFIVGRVSVSAPASHIAHHPQPRATLKTSRLREARVSFGYRAAGEIRNPSFGIIENTDRREMRLRAHIKPVRRPGRHRD